MDSRQGYLCWLGSLTDLKRQVGDVAFRRGERSRPPGKQRGPHDQSASEPPQGLPDCSPKTSLRSLFLLPSELGHGVATLGKSRYCSARLPWAPDSRPTQLPRSPQSPQAPRETGCSPGWGLAYHGPRPPSFSLHCLPRHSQLPRRLESPCQDGVGTPAPQWCSPKAERRPTGATCGMLRTMPGPDTAIPPSEKCRAC